MSTTTDWESTETDDTMSVAWGDYDGDDDLDLAVGNGCDLSHPDCRSVRLYRNDEGDLTTSTIWASEETDNTTSIAWGGYDRDGDLDLAVGNGCDSSYPDCRSVRLYRNEGGDLMANAIWSSTKTDDTRSVAWGDYDGDGYLDLAVGNSGESGQPNRIYRNDGGSLTFSATWSSDEAEQTTSVAWGDYDGDGTLTWPSGILSGPTGYTKTREG